MRTLTVLLAILSVILAACAAEARIEPSATSGEPVPTAEPTESEILEAAETAVPIPEHRIGIRVVDGVGEFYDRITGEVFVPRGTNYVRVAWQMNHSVLYHSMFNPSLYNPVVVEQALTQMQAVGYNVVRVFLNHCCPTDALADASGISTAYVANVADFLTKAKEHEIYVFVVIDGAPLIGKYLDLIDIDWSEKITGANADILRRGGVLAHAQIWMDFIKELEAIGAPLDAIFAYELRNEQFFERNVPPINLSSGMIRTANGSVYDMAKPEEKERMMDEGLVYWIDHVRAAILEVDPTALVGIGFFVPQEPHAARPGDPRLVRTQAAMYDSTVDFIDLHLYPGYSLSVRQYVDNFGSEAMQGKPIIMGEFGGAKAVYGSVSYAATTLRDWQVISCSHGFDGWLFWTWDLPADPYYYTELEGDGAINQMLSPAFRPDPCSAD